MRTSAAPRCTAAASRAAAANAAARPATRERITGVGSELDLRGLLRAFLGLEVGLLVEATAEETGDEDGGEAHPRGVEGLGLFVEAHALDRDPVDRKSTRLNSSHVKISYAVFCLKKKK